MAGLAQGLSIKVRGWGAGQAHGPAKPFRGLLPYLLPSLGYKIDAAISFFVVALLTRTTSLSAMHTTCERQIDRKCSNWFLTLSF